MPGPVRAGAGVGKLRDVGHRDRPAAAGADVIDRLAVRDGEDPGLQVGGVAQTRIGAQRRDPGLLVAIIGVDATDAGDEKAMHVASVVVDQGLKGGKVH